MKKWKEKSKSEKLEEVVGILFIVLILIMFM